MSSKIIPFLTGFHCLRALLNALTDQPFEIAIEDYRKRFAVLRFFNFPVGRVKRIFVNKKITEKLMTFTLTEYLEEGAYVKPIKDSRDRLGYFVVSGSDRDDVLRWEKQAEMAVRLEYY